VSLCVCCFVNIWEVISLISEGLKHFRITVTNKNDIHNEIKSEINVTEYIVFI
jgi:hypothetical protein